MIIRVRDIIFMAKSGEIGGIDPMNRLFDWKLRRNLLHLQIFCGLAASLIAALFVSLLTEDASTYASPSVSLVLFISALAYILVMIAYQLTKVARISEEYIFSLRLYSRILQLGRFSFNGNS